MNPSRVRSFAFRLTLLITVVSGLAAALVCTVLVLLHTQRVLNAAVETASAHAKVIAANSTAALDFDDADAAHQTLEGLAAVGEFAAAEITRPDGTLFARYDRDQENSAAEKQAGVEAGNANELAGETENGELGTLSRGISAHIQGRWLTVPQPIVRDGDVIGHLALLYDLGPARRRLVQDVAVAAIITLGVIGLAFIAARGLQRSLLRPVQELSRVAGTIASTENYRIRARKYSHDELGVLTDVFNTMVGRIGEAESIRRNHQAMLEREVAARTAEILDTQARLRQAERLASLGTLSAGLGHDIGNLLMPLRSHLGSIRDKALPLSDEIEHDFVAITKATEYLQNLSSGLRLLARDPDEASLRREATALAAWWLSIEPLLRAMVGRSIALHHDLPEDLPRVKISESLLMQAVFNVVQNAAHVLAPEGGAPKPGARIDISASVVAGRGGDAQIEISVKDNGPGMTPEVRQRCIEPYFTTKTRRISSGLGLSLVKGIVESAGGELRIESEPGNGSTFTMVLSAEAPAPQTPKIAAYVAITDPRRRAIVSHMLRSLNCNVRTGASGEPEPAGSASCGVWVTDSFDTVPASWRGRVVVLADEPAQSVANRDRITVLDPSTSLPDLRSILKELLPGV